MSIGEALVQARQDAGLTTAQVADTTRIRRTLVEAIERDDYTLCGGDVYARGHIGTIARTVGLDPAPLLAEFDAAHASSAPQGTRVFEAETAARTERSGPNWAAAMVVALVFVVGIGLWQVVRQPDQPREVTSGIVPTASGSPSPSPSSSTPVEPTPSPSGSAIAEAPKGVVVVVTASGGRSWISATAGGSQVFAGILEDGQSKKFTDPDKVKLIVGNAGAVQLKVNGADLGAPGASGQVARLTFVPGDPTVVG